MHVSNHSMYHICFLSLTLICCQAYDRGMKAVKTDFRSYAGTAQALHRLMAALIHPYKEYLYGNRTAH